MPSSYTERRPACCSLLRQAEEGSSFAHARRLYTDVHQMGSAQILRDQSHDEQKAPAEMHRFKKSCA